MKLIHNIFIFSVLLFFFNTEYTFAQINIITLDKALQLSEENYPQLKAGRMEVEKQKILKSSAFDFGTTSLSTGKDDVKDGNAGAVINFGISQSDIDIFGMLANSKLQRAKVQLAEAGFDIVKKQITLEVRKAYNNLVFYEKTLDVYKQIDSVYSNFVKAAQLRTKTGESSKLALLNASAKYRELQVQIKRTMGEKKAAKYKLNQFLLQEEDFSIDKNSYPELNIDNIDTSLLETNNVQIAFLHEKINVAEREWKQNRAQWLPKLSLSYANKTVDGEHGFYGYEAGLSFSLFNGQLSKTKSAKLQTEIERENLYTAKLELASLLQQLLSKYNSLLDLQEYYKEKALPLSDEQIKSSTLAYKLGEIDYMNYIQNIESALTIKLNYISADLEFRNIQSEIIYLLKTTNN